MIELKTRAEQFLKSIQAEGEIYDGVTLDAHIVEGGLKFFLPAEG